MGKKRSTKNQVSLSEMDAVTEKAMQVEMTPSAIPDIRSLLENISDIMNDIESEPLASLEKRNKKEFDRILSQKYFHGKNVPLKIINLLCESGDARYDNLNRLLDMMDRLSAVKTGKSEINTAFQAYSEKLNEDFIYSKHGGKENFEKKMAEENEKNKK